MSNSSYTKKSNISIRVDLSGKWLWFLVQAVLVILKLGGILNVSWWLIWIPTLLPVGAVVVVFMVMFIAAIFSPKFRDFIRETADEVEEKKVEIEIDGADDDSSDASR